ncbi:Na+/H+ antiporter subunit E [Tropicimonas isoalkanivorans]|uniref:Multicomponent Na+:H+ antiporter subunit E n=1 Tax=Tropicimonas isoalkanivorans TaxID=441112 RepID=A0A1I1HGJ3_9RHOB|nr:Na+/H+ antiporter subunit E [Tropicimonas isoalkanivorans]SFC23064.1 multicomponent Na+:H+ antiporter subunit E [Tropicimonas isoalkanivorans]
MSDTFAPAKLFATMFVFWLLLNGALQLDVIVVGLLVAGGITYFFAGSLSFLSGYRVSVASAKATAGYLAFFFTELVRANLAMAWLVLDPALPMTPAIVKVRTRLQHPVARLLLANSITLTPGTLSVELRGEWIYVHWVVAQTTDPEAATEAIVAGFEKYLEVMYD